MLDMFWLSTLRERDLELTFHHGHPDLVAAGGRFHLEQVTDRLHE